jgi:hypothetical protein
LAKAAGHIIASTGRQQAEVGRRMDLSLHQLAGNNSVLGADWWKDSVIRKKICWNGYAMHR